MARRARYAPAKLQVDFVEDRRGVWQWFRKRGASGHGSRKGVGGRELVYRVVDKNFDRLNSWTYLVQVPNDDLTPVIVRPREAPGRKAWAGIDRKSIAFKRARRHPYRGKLYCKVTLADPRGEKTKFVARRDERGNLPEWMDHFRSITRVKKTVTTTKGRDGDQLVLIVKPDDHRQMILIFFATKVWVLQEGFEL